MHVTNGYRVSDNLAVQELEGIGRLYRVSRADGSVVHECERKPDADVWCNGQPKGDVEPPPPEPAPLVPKVYTTRPAPVKKKSAKKKSVKKE